MAIRKASPRHCLDAAHELRVTVTGCTRLVQAQARQTHEWRGKMGTKSYPSLRSYLHLMGGRESPFLKTHSQVGRLHASG